jgi:hypothetical protein
MKQPAAPMGLAIKVVTGGALALNAGFYIAACYQPALLVAGLFLSAIVLGCYLFWAPVAYELTDGELTVWFRIGRVRYQPVVKCSRLESLRGCSIRLCGNGGLFAGSGIFWNRQLGVFRAYVTTSQSGTAVLVETANRRIVISPADPAAWVTAW